MFAKRGSLLRDVDPRRAIIDLSNSLLLHDNFDNVASYFFRGLAYTNLKQFAFAVADFQAVIRAEQV